MGGRSSVRRRPLWVAHPAGSRVRREGRWEKLACTRHAVAADGSLAAGDPRDGGMPSFKGPRHAATSDEDGVLSLMEGRGGIVAGLPVAAASAEAVAEDHPGRGQTLSAPMDTRTWVWQAQPEYRSQGRSSGRVENSGHACCAS